MMVQDTFRGSDNGGLQYSKTSQETGLGELFYRPSWFSILFIAVFAVFVGAIRITRKSVSLTIYSYREFEKSNGNCKRRIRSWLGGEKGFCTSILKCCGKLPRRIRNFFIEAFLVPAYRNEWGHYRAWSYRSESRDPQSSYLRKILRNEKRAREVNIAGYSERVAVHDHRGCHRVRINVGGVRYETQIRTLERFPDSLLGNPNKRINHFDPVKKEYYFDRNRHAFEAILYFYQSGGRFRRPENVQADVLLEDAEFYQINKAVIEQYRIDEGFAPSSSKQEILPKNLLRRKLWLLFEHPGSSDQSSLVGILSIFVLVVSLILFCLETLETMRSDDQQFNQDGKEKELRDVTPFQLCDPVVLTDTCCNCWFIFEFVMRLINCPMLWNFIKSPLNLIDVVAVLPFILNRVTHLIATVSIPQTGGTSAYILNITRVIRMARIFRIFKLSRHSRGLKILAKTLKASLNELILLLVIIIMGSVIFSSVIYFLESQVPNSKFSSIPEGLWWALVTITTVGFGDVVPLTIGGKIVGALCAIAGVLTTSLPVPVIVSNFNFFYHQAIDERDLVWISVNHITTCPCRQYGDVKVKRSSGTVGATLYSSDEDFGSLKRIEFD